MPYDDDVHTSKAHYECEIVKDAKRRMAATDVNFNLFLCGALLNQKDSGETEAGKLPTAASDVFGKEAPFDSKNLASSSNVASSSTGRKPKYNRSLSTSRFCDLFH